MSEEKIIEKKIDLKEAETEHLKMKGKVEEAIIHAYSMLAIKVGMVVLAIIAVVAYILRVVGGW